MQKIKSVFGPSAYPTGGFDVTLGEFEKVTQAQVSAGGGYMAEVASITGNTIKVLVRYFDYDATSDGTAIQVPANTDLDAVTFVILAEGQ